MKTSSNPLDIIRFRKNTRKSSPIAQKVIGSNLDKSCVIIKNIKFELRGNALAQNRRKLSVRTS